MPDSWTDKDDAEFAGPMRTMESGVESIDFLAFLDCEGDTVTMARDKYDLLVAANHDLAAALNEALDAEAARARRDRQGAALCLLMVVIAGAVAWSARMAR